MPHGTNPLPIAHYRADIDGLRAVAILLVLWFHAFPDSLPGGYVGVDVFFVISGFLITGIVLRGLDEGSFSFAKFYLARARRLLPGLMLVLPATLAAGWYWLWPQEYQQLASHAVASAFFLMNFVLWGETGYFDVATELKPLMHLWSLGIEEQFYLIYPCLLWFSWRLWRRPVIAIAGVASVSLIANLLWMRHDPSGAFFLPQTRFWELAFGGLLAWYQHKHRHQLDEPQRRHHRYPHLATATVNPTPPISICQHASSWFGLIAIMAAAVMLSGDTPYPGTAALLPVLGAFALIAAGPHSWLNRQVLGSRLMVNIGLISYPLYLWHWPLLSFLHIVHSEPPSPALRWGALAMTFLLAWMTYRWVETPIRFGARRGTKLAGVCATMCLTALTAWGIHAGGGLPERLPSEANTLLTYQYDYQQGYREGSCFLRPEQGPEAFVNCPDDWSRPGTSWLIWGDSHAAHLRPGILAQFGTDGRFVQRSASGCPPLKDERFPDRPHCDEIQEHVWEEIEAHRPRRVTLAARWDFYNWHKLEETIARLRTLGVEDIDVVGPVPQWHNGLPRQAAIAYREHRFSRLPERLSNGLVPTPFKLDAEMAELAQRLKVRYLSPLQALCNSDGCLARHHDNIYTLTAWDDAHLTESGSELLVGSFTSRSGM